MHEICRQLQAQAQVHAGDSSDPLQGQSELPSHMPSSLAIAARGGLQGLRLQLALLGHNFDQLEFETLGVVDSYNVPPALSMSEEEINVLPVHKYRVTDQESEGLLQQQSSSSPAAKVSVLILFIHIIHYNPIRFTVRTLPCLHQGVLLGSQPRDVEDGENEESKSGCPTPKNNTQDISLSSQPGDEVTKGLEIGIGTMAHGEKATIYVSNPYLTECTFMTDVKGFEDVQFDVDLVHFIQVRDMLGDGRLIKRRIRDGKGEFPMDCPLPRQSTTCPL